MVPMKMGLSIRKRAIHGLVRTLEAIASTSLAHAKAAEAHARSLVEESPYLGVDWSPALRGRKARDLDYTRGTALAAQRGGHFPTAPQLLSLLHAYAEGTLPAELAPAAERARGDVLWLRTFVQDGRTAGLIVHDGVTRCKVGGLSWRAIEYDRQLFYPLGAHRRADRLELAPSMDHRDLAPYLLGMPSQRWSSKAPPVYLEIPGFCGPLVLDTESPDAWVLRPSYSCVAGTLPTQEVSHYDHPLRLVGEAPLRTLPRTVRAIHSYLVEKARGGGPRVAS